MIKTLPHNQPTPSGESAFRWPEGKRAAVSLSFDDARFSQVDTGLTLLDRYGVQASFYVSLDRVEQRLEGWRNAVVQGHEIGNHTVNHPCTGNFAWVKAHPLENYTLDQMQHELVEANRRIETLLGITPQTFAYPCGQTFVGRGQQTQSYIPLVAKLFSAGRGWLNECSNDPIFCDLAQVMGTSLDGLTFEQVELLLQSARETGHWLVLAGHEIGPDGRQTTRIPTLERLLAYTTTPDSDLWLAPVATVASYLRKHRLS